MGIFTAVPGPRKGKIRAICFGFFVALSGFLFGYDTGIVGR